MKENIQIIFILTLLIMGMFGGLIVIGAIMDFAVLIIKQLASEL